VRSATAERVLSQVVYLWAEVMFHEYSFPYASLEDVNIFLDRARRKMDRRCQPSRRIRNMGTLSLQNPGRLSNMFESLRG
jgi:hypothetical protein